MDVLIEATELAVRVASDPRTVVLDVRWKLGDPRGREQYLAGHIPGAVYVDLETELAAPPSAAAGRHPLPELASLQSAARGWGLRNGDAVIAYDDNGGMSAARAWWLLRWAGVPDVRLLNGGLGAWKAAGHELASGLETPTPGDVILNAGAVPVLSPDDAAGLAADGLLLDARAAERYRGEFEPVDPRAGHIPGAVSAPTSDNVDASGHFLPTESLKARFEKLGVAGRVGVYCGSGVTATHQIAALAIAGIDADLYPGSWSQWSADPDRPIATGPTPAG